MPKPLGHGLWFDKNREDLWRVLRFMQWYLKKYGLDVGKKKKAAAQKEEKQDMGRRQTRGFVWCNEISWKGTNLDKRNIEIEG